jgi:hypothetical protein
MTLDRVKNANTRRHDTGQEKLTVQDNHASMLRAPLLGKYTGGAVEGVFVVGHL